jgi:glycosyltransferase involved in cell wall biosynthesis
VAEAPTSVAPGGRSASSRGDGHIVHVITRYLRGGSERRVRDIVDAMPEATHELVVGAHSLPDAAVREARFTAVTVVPTLVRSPSPTDDPRALASIVRILRAVAPDVVVTHQSKAGALGRLAAAHLRVPAIASLSMANFGPGYPAVAGSFFRTLERRLQRSTAAYAVVGHDLATRFERNGVPPAKLHVVRSGMRLPQEPYGERAADLRERLGVSRSRKMLAYVGSLESRKNVLDLVPLVQRMRHEASSPPFLAIAGEGPLRAELERRVLRAGIGEDVALLGYLDDPLALIAAADALVLLSRAEGVSQVLVQAAALDTPFVAYDVDGVRELSTMGARGRMVPLGDRSAVADAVREVLGWPPSEGRSSIDLTGWSRPAIRAAYRALFADVIGRIPTPL